jgi:phosphoenolpyruvate synthase/pyruvate phosphate dikinase
VGTVMPLVMALEDQAATVAVAGGKGASLGRLARAGFAVPPGFVVTTSAYQQFLTTADLTGPLLETMAQVRPSDPGTFETASLADRRAFRRAPGT